MGKAINIWKRSTVSGSVLRIFPKNSRIPYLITRYIITKMKVSAYLTFRSIAAEADLMEVVIVRLGGEEQNEKGLMDLLYGVFSGDQKKVLSYIPDSDSQIRQKEVSDMLSMISYAEEKGEKEAKKGERKAKKGIKKVKPSWDAYEMLLMTNVMQTQRGHLKMKIQGTIIQGV